MIHFIIQGKPIAKARPRMGQYGVYTPKNTKSYEHLVQLIAQSAMSKAGKSISSQPIGLSIKFFMPKSKGSKMGNHPIKKPDIDNLVKSIMDGLNKVVYKDDAQVVWLRSDKLWGDSESTEVCVTELTESILDRLPPPF